MAETSPQDSTPQSNDSEFQTEPRPHKPADDREEIYYEGCPLLRAEIGRILLAVLTAAALIAIVFFGRKYLPWWVNLVLCLLAVITVIVPVWLTRSTRYRISNYRIDYERGILSKRIDTLELWHVEDIRFHQSLLDRVLSVGTITIFSHDETTPELHIEGVPNPRPLFETLKQRVIAVKRQRGVVKMDIG